MTEPTRPGQSPRRDSAPADTEELQLRSRALGDPTRYRIFREIARRQRPVAVAELTAAFGLNHNTVRQHLRKLCDAGLLDEVGEPPRGPGRPRLLYQLSADAANDWNAEGPYERLSLLLLELAATDATPREVGRAAGRAVRLDPAGLDPLEVLRRVMTAQGFAPRVDRNGDRAEVTLLRCPFATAAEANPSVVCDLHRGMTEGLVGQLDDVDAPRLVARHPRSGACAVHLKVQPA